ncbi:MAG: glycosyltransferase [Sphingobacteriaceae bacterium]|nr:MAG: glycosyltransferase [Sphingobacteriaceae bacterium]
MSSSKVRVITYVHELAYTIQTFDQASIKKALVQTNLFLAGSVAVKRNLLEMGVITEQVQVVPSSIPVAAITDKLAVIDTASVRASLQLQQHDQLLVAVGTADWRKGNDLFIQMAAHLAQRYPQVHFAWVGVAVGSLEHQRMSYEILKYRLGGRFHAVPVTSEYLKYIAASDIFVLPSREDPFPLVVLEAAAAGKPVVCFAETGGSPDFVGEKNGAVVPYGDTNAMSAAIELLLKDPIIRQHKGEHARAVVKQEYNIPQVATRIAQLLASE